MNVDFELHEGIALVLVDRPPVNAIDAGVRAGLLDAIQRAQRNPEILAVVIACRGRTFMSGADLAELGGVIPAPSYADTLATIEDCSKPVIASLHGTALGGGLEIAMACHYRCATPTARMGMPEITLGILPGAGGTQRLPRLVGTRHALDLLIAGAPIDATRARHLGLVDELIGDDPIAGGLAYARRLVAAGAAARPTRQNDSRLEQLDEPAIAEVLARHARSLKGRSTQQLVLRALAAARPAEFAKGLQLEAELSAESLRTRESLALRHVFFAERDCGRVPGIPTQGKSVEIRSAVVVGAGTMGTGIAMALADAGVAVNLVERDATALERGLSIIRSNYDGAVQRGRIDVATAEARRGLIRGAMSLDAARDADLAIEAVFEDLELKRSLLAELDGLLPARALLASNTSSLSLQTLADATRRPERVIGLHFFSPANVMRLLEIVRSSRTSHDAIRAALSIAKLLRKVGVVVGDGFGFVGNRMMLDGYFREVDLLLLQGIAPGRIDAVMEAFGFAMGPNKVNDMAGVDVGTRVRGELLRRAARPGPYHVVSDALTACGRLGQKSGVGIYRYEKDDRTAHEDPAFAPLVAQLAERHGVKPRECSDAEIESRCVLSLVNVGASILSEGLASRASDIDVIWTAGYGFPRWRGGPLWHADSLGLKSVVEQMHQLADTGGGRYWSVPPLLAQLAHSGRTFAEWDRERGS